MQIEETTIANVLTRTGGYLADVTSHSLQPYRGCSYGLSLCGVGCYVRHNPYVTRGRTWGAFLEARVNAADSYRRNVDRERRWARSKFGHFSVFLSSSTDPFVPQEFELGVTRDVLTAMVEAPPDRLIVQTHSHRLTEYAELYAALEQDCDVRLHVSIESDRDRLPGLPSPPSSVAARLAAAKKLKDAGHHVVVTVSPLLPIDAPDAFFAATARAANAVVLDHYIGGDGSANGSRTLRTPLPDAMEAVLPESTKLEYLERMAEIAEQHLPGRVGVGAAGFGGRYR